MFNKTSSVQFLKYGEVYLDTLDRGVIGERNHTLKVVNDNLIYLYEANDDIFVKALEGICMLVVTDDINSNKFEEFVIHRVVKINKGVFFNFISLGNEAKVELAFLPETIIQTRFFENQYSYNRMRPTIRINELVAYYYNVRSSNYVFTGETDNHWEFTFVDTGKLHTAVDNQSYTLKSNQVIVYAPGQFHNQNTEIETCSYLSVIVDMDLPDRYKDKLINRVFDLDRTSKIMLEEFVRSSDLKRSYNRDAMIMNIEFIIIQLLRSTEKTTQKVASTPMQQKFENELLNEIIMYINENIYTAFNVEELCETFALSRSSLQSLFRNNLNIAPKEYISNIKLEKSKVLIKESKYSISEIANILGFSSIHYFSRRFKQEFGVSPSEYANKISY